MLKPIHIAGILVLLAVAAARGPSAASGFVADYAIALICIIVFFRCYNAWITYQSIRNLEALDFDERPYYLSFVKEPELLGAIEQGLLQAQDPPPGMVEVFQPSPALRSLLEWPFWLGIGIATALLVVRTLQGSLSVASWLLVVGGICTGAYAWARLRTLRHSLELSPFAITETYPHGGRRSLPWAAVAGLRQRRLLRVMELLPARGAGTIVVSYDVTRGTKLTELLLRYLKQSHSNDAS